MPVSSRITILLLIAITASLAPAADPPRTAAAAAKVREVIGHMGSCADRPGNTLAGIRRAIEARATAAEVDARTTRDGVLVCVHDPEVDRTTDGTGKVANLTLADIKKLDAGVKFDAKFTGERVPTLREVLTLAKGKIGVMIDLKEDGEPYVKAIAAEVRAAGEPKRLVLGVRSVGHAKRFRELLPEARQIGLVPTADDIEPFAAAGVKVIRLWPKWLTDESLVPRVRKLGLELHLGTGTGTRAEVLPLSAHAPDSLASDDPARLRATLAELSGKKKPNVLLLLADDMRADSIAAPGNPVARTPTLDTLVNRGFAFTNAYCFGGNSPAVCTPSRNMLLSGNAYFRWKDFTPPGMKGQRGLLAPGGGPTFPLAMKDAGYLTYHHGKRGNTAPLIQAKFEVNKYLKNDDAERRSGEPGREIVDDAIAFLKANADPRPVFMYLAFANPHDPRVAAPKYLDRFDPATIPLPKNFLPIHPFDNGELVVRDEQLLPWPRTEADVRRTLREYHATVSALDHHIGRLLQAMKESGQLDNTLVIFSADQGIAVGSHGLLGKQSLYDHSMKSPLVLAGPGIRHGTSAALVYLFDIFPTVCDLVGAKVPPGIDGRSFRPVIDGKATAARPELMLAYRDKMRAIRDDRWKLIRYPAVGVTQLFDLQADPDETKNLAAVPGQQDRVNDLLGRLAKLQQHYGDDLRVTVANPRPAAPVTAEQLRERAKPAAKK